MKPFYLLISFAILSFTCFAQNDYSLEFNGTDNYVSINAVNAITNSNYTVEAWFKSSSFATTQAIVDGYEDATPNTGLYLEIQTNGTLRFLHREPAGVSGGTEVFSTSVINDGQWHHFAAVKGPDDFLRLYIDGNLEAVSSNSVLNFTIPLPLNLGRNHNDIRYFSGRLDEFRVWNLARTQDEIQATLNCLPNGNEPGLAGYWKFEEGLGNQTTDQTATANSGMLENGTFWSTDTPTYLCCTGFEKVNGQSCYVVYHGYAPQACTYLTTAVTGGTLPYAIQWNNGALTPSIYVCPSSDQLYIATITDANGCMLLDTFEVKAVNVICGNNNDKVKICHNSHNTLCISESAVEAHLTNHGDYLGDCGPDPCDDTIITNIEEGFSANSFQIYPNPANDFVYIKIAEITDPMELQIHSFNGHLVKKLSLSDNEFYLTTLDMEAGIYHISLNSSSMHWVQKLVIIK